MGSRPIQTSKTPKNAGRSLVLLSFVKLASCGYLEHAQHEQDPHIEEQGEHVQMMEDPEASDCRRWRKKLVDLKFIR